MIHFFCVMAQIFQKKEHTMKNSWTKLGCLLTSVALLFVMLVGCQSAPKVDPVQEALGFSSDTVFATFNGEIGRAHV